MISHFHTMQSSVTGDIMIATCYKGKTTTFCILCDSIFRLFTNIHVEHNDLWSHCRHFVVETVLVHSIRMSRKCVLTIALTITRIYSFAIWTRNLNTVLQIKSDWIYIYQNRQASRQCLWLYSIKWIPKHTLFPTKKSCIGYKLKSCTGMGITVFPR